MASRNRLQCWLGFGLLTSCTLAVSSPASAEILFRGTFENGLEPEWETESCCSYSADIVSGPVRGGNKAIKFLFKKSDAENGGKRSELRLEPVPRGSERWYAVSIYVPNSFKTTEGGYIITQFHDTPDPGEPWKIPPLYLATDGEKLTLVNRWDSDSYTPERGGQDQEWSLGSLTKGRWIDVVFHVKWSHESNGLMEMWKDGKLVVRKQGPNTYNDREGPYFKIGMYAAGISSEPEEYNFDEQTIYFDRIRIGDSNSSYQEVATGENGAGPSNPGGSNPPPNGKTIRIEAEQMNLSTYLVEATDGPASGKKVISLAGARPEGTATANFPGSSGRYNVVVGYFDEEDGRGRMSLKQNGQELDWWTFDQQLGSGSMEPKTFVRKAVKTGVAIRKGDKFQITGVRDGSEYTRIDYLEFVPVGR